jgi:glucokinase
MWRSLLRDKVVQRPVSPTLYKEGSHFDFTPLTNREYAYFTVTGKEESGVVSSILKIKPTNNWYC